MKSTRPVSYPFKAIAVFTVALVLQSGHMVEHVAQLYQHAVLWWPIKESHGILFFADLEWNHFIFNTTYFLLLAYFAVQAHIFHKRNGTNQWARYAFLAGFYVQGYHVIEHASRIGQHLQTGCSPCPGILAWTIDGIWLHFAFNSFTLALPAVSFFALGLHRQVLPSSRRAAQQNEAPSLEPLEQEAE